MKDTFKKIGFFLVTIAITAVIVWALFLDKESQQDTLSYSLNLLGDRLMAMVPESNDKASVQELYDKFVTQAKQQEVPPEKIETVAANILNVSNMEQEITSEQAKALLEVSLSNPVKIERGATDSIEIQVMAKTSPVIVIPPPPEKVKAQVGDYQKLGDRLVVVCESNKEMREAMREYAKNMKAHQMHYRIDKDLRLIMDEKFKERLKEKKFRRLSKQLQEAERKKIIVWHKDFSEKFQKDMERLKVELESLEKLKQLEQLEKLEQLKNLEALKSLQSLKSLEALKYVPVVNSDSIRIIVEKELMDAGVIQESGKKN